MVPDNDARRGAIALWPLAAAALAVGAAFLASRPPSAASFDEALPRFSAARAGRHVEALATGPRTLGSDAHAAAAEYILAELEELGLETTVQETTWTRSSNGRTTAARVRNLLARMPGTDPNGDTVLLLAHYDSQPQTPGAGDDASGVAVILETLRALRGRARRNDVLAVITDGEELGLIGAAAFVGEHPWFAEVDMTLDFEARGQRGPAIMFEASEGSLGRVRDFARAAPYPMADSLSYEIYRRMPNDTDFSVIRRAGGQGLNFAMIEGLSAYHSALDDAASFSRRTLQHEGANAVALARYFAERPIPEGEGSEGVYFNPAGIRFLWVYSRGTARVLAVALLPLLAIVLAIGLRRGARASRILWAATSIVPVALLAAAASWLAGRGVAAAFPGWTAGPHGVPYAQGLATLGHVGLGVGCWFGCLRLWRGTVRELLLGIASLWSVLAAAVAWSVPGASHLLFWPAALLVAGTLIVDLAPRPEERWWIAALGVLPAVGWWSVMLWLSFVSLTVGSAPVLALPVVLAATLLSPGLVPASARARLGAAALSLVSGLALLTAAAAGSGPNARRPHVDSLFLLQDAASGEATWRSLDRAPDPWSAVVLGTAPERRELPEVLSAAGAEVLTAGADPLPLEPPEVIVETEEPEAGGRRRLSLRLRPRRGTVLRLWARGDTPLREAWIDGRQCGLDERGELRLSYHGATPEGVELDVVLGREEPLRLDLLEASYGLPAGAPSGRPAGRAPRPGWWTDTTMVWSRRTL